MKKLLSLSVILLMSFSSINTDPVERIGIKGPIEFNKTDFFLAWSEKPSENYYVQEYLPKNETVDSFNQLITVNVFVVDVSVDNAIQQKQQELTERKKTDKVCNFSLIKSPDGKESILDCLLSSGKQDKLDVIEFIIYRYKQIELENHRKALLVYSYSKRSYGDNIISFLKDLKTERTNLLNTMIAIELPKIKLKG